MNDKRLLKWLMLLILLPLSLAIFGGDRFRYPCQDPANWDKEFCQKPLCDVTRSCPEHIFKGGRDPRLGPPGESTTSTQSQQLKPITSGVNCK